MVKLGILFDINKGDITAQFTLNQAHQSSKGYVEIVETYD